MTFEEFKKEIEKGTYNTEDIACMAAEISGTTGEIDEMTIKALSFLTSVEEAEDIFKNFLKSKGIIINE